VLINTIVIATIRFLKCSLGLCINNCDYLGRSFVQRPISLGFIRQNSNSYVCIFMKFKLGIGILWTTKELTIFWKVRVKVAG